MFLSLSSFTPHARLQKGIAIIAYQLQYCSHSHRPRCGSMFKICDIKLGTGFPYKWMVICCGPSKSIGPRFRFDQRCVFISCNHGLPNKLVVPQGILMRIWWSNNQNKKIVEVGYFAVVWAQFFSCIVTFKFLFQAHKNGRRGQPRIMCLKKIRCKQILACLFPNPTWIVPWIIICKTYPTFWNYLSRWLCPSKFK